MNKEKIAKIKKQIKDRTPDIIAVVAGTAAIALAFYQQKQLQDRNDALRAANTELESLTGDFKYVAQRLHETHHQLEDMLTGKNGDVQLWMTDKGREILPEHYGEVCFEVDGKHYGLEAHEDCPDTN
jgi:5-bromo-4-chloroindolyl phosphate hydrolysis protein